jgi:hypothetical protein
MGMTSYAGSSTSSRISERYRNCRSRRGPARPLRRLVPHPSGAGQHAELVGWLMGQLQSIEFLLRWWLAKLEGLDVVLPQHVNQILATFSRPTKMGFGYNGLLYGVAENSVGNVGAAAWVRLFRHD